MMDKRWTIQSLKEEALKYGTRSEFAKHSMGAYLSSKRKGVYLDITSHMPTKVDQAGEKNSNAKWTFEKLFKEALKYTTRQEFCNNNQAAYLASSRRKDHDLICAHMPIRKNTDRENNHRFKWTFEKLQAEALKYSSRGEFQLKNESAYNISIRKGVADQITSHMNYDTGTSYSEKTILDYIKQFYPKTQKIRDSRVKIENRPHVKGFEIDIYVPELRKGIEFDGTYYHSFQYMRRSNSKKKWSDEDIKNYHQIKDDYFASKGVQILHIKEEDWKSHREFCNLKIKEFLNIVDIVDKNSPNLIVGAPKEQL